MIPVRDNSGNYHETVAIYDGSGKEIAEVRDNQGRLLFKNWSEISGVPPLHFTSRGEHLLDYRIYGNTVQNGTPAPETPVEVQGCGERTENFFEEIASPVSTKIHRQIYVGDGYFTLSTNAPLVKNESALFFLVSGYTDSANIGVPNMAYNGVSRTVESVDGYVTVVYRSVSGLQPQNYQTMLTPGTAPPDHYIPYGYKIPVTVSDGTNSITTPVYIGNEPLHKIGDYADYVDYKRGVVVRRIKKLVLTGGEGWTITSNGVFRIGLSGQLRPSTPLCTHYLGSNSTAWSNVPDKSVTVSIGGYLAILDTTYTAAADFKSYLAQQYAAGTPVTIWYVLAEPEEEPLENLLPIQTIRDTNILTENTEVQPSEMYIKGRIKPIT